MYSRRWCFVHEGGRGTTSSVVFSFRLILGMMSIELHNSSCDYSHTLDANLNYCLSLTVTFLIIYCRLLMFCHTRSSLLIDDEAIHVNLFTKEGHSTSQHQRRLCLWNSIYPYFLLVHLILLPPPYLISAFGTRDYMHAFHHLA